MRVISGSAKGRTLRAVPGNSTRPTSDKVKEALFSMIGPYFLGGNVLDLFAGTGALGIEAMSRGMSHAVFVDQDQKAIETIRMNLQATHLTAQAEVYRNDAMRALKVLAKRQLTFDLIFLDPPYRMKDIATWMHVIQDALLCTSDTQLVIEHDSHNVLESKIGAFGLSRSAIYGDTAITIYGNVSSQGGE